LLIGRRICAQAMDWKAYTLHMLATNLVMALIIFLILVFQDLLPLNPLHFAGMDPVLAFNTAISFITNTDWRRKGTHCGFREDRCKVSNNTNIFPTRVYHRNSAVVNRQQHLIFLPIRLIECSESP
jgi:hypothetical protein